MRHKETPSIVVHIGAHKTGSTLMQHVLGANKWLLLSQGTRVLARRNVTTYIGRPSSQSAPDGLGQFLERPLSRMCRRIIITDERLLGGVYALRWGCPGLYPGAPLYLDHLRQQLDSFRVRILLCIRPVHEFVESWYAQTVMMGSKKTFADFWSRMQPASLSWRMVCEQVVKRFGRENFSLVDFRLIRKGTPFLIEALAAKLGVKLHFAEAQDWKQNTRLSGAGLAIALAGNRTLTSSSDRLRLRQFLQEHFTRNHQSAPILFSPEQREHLDNLWSAEYEDLVREYGASLPQNHSSS